MRILIVEDEKHLAEAMTQILKKNNYTVDTVYDGEDGLDYALSGIYDAILLDIMLPKLDGLSLLTKLRKEHIQTPVMLLTAKSDISDKVKGLDCGADDYLAKPFDTRELLARLRAITRRKGEVIYDDCLEFSDIKLDTQNLVLSCNAATVTLTLKEYELLEYLILNKNIVNSKEQIIEKVWGFDSEAESNHVEVYISFLRKKLAFLKSKATITTIRGLGYRLEEG